MDDDAEETIDRLCDIVMVLTEHLAAARAEISALSVMSAISLAHMALMDEQPNERMSSITGSLISAIAGMADPAQPHIGPAMSAVTEQVLRIAERAVGDVVGE